MRFTEATTPEQNSLKRTVERDMRLGSWLKMKIEDGIAKRYWLDETWRAVIRQYEAIPELRSRELPNDQGQFIVEIPLGASMSDSITSAVYDLVFNTSPCFTCRGSVGYADQAYSFQLLANKLIIDKFVNFRNAANEVIADTVQLGTGAYYTVNAREVVKRDGFIERKTGPRVFSVAPEDLVVPGGTFPDINSMQLIAQRNYYFESELVEAARINGWNTSNFTVAGNVEWVRQRRIEAAKTDVDLQIIGGLYEVFACHCFYDYDQDGYAEDLQVIWDRTSYSVGSVTYAPYDSRPFSISRYILRPHIFYGIGVLEMAQPFEREVTEWHNFKMQNAHLANARFWAYRLGALGQGEELKISPNNSVGLADPEHDLVAKEMGDVYPTAQQYEAAVIALAEMRVGTPALGPMQGIQTGKRVPAATAMAALQQQNRRFAAPFDNIREALADSLTQCFMRLREEYLKGGVWRNNVVQYLVYTVGVKHAENIESVFKTATSVDMRDQVIIEVTATTQSINKQADKQNALERMSVMGQYYEKVLGLGQIILNPKTPPEMKQLAMQVVTAATETVKTFLRTFDDVRDPEIFIPNMIEDMKEQANGNPQAAAGAAPQPNDQQNPSGQPGTETPPSDVSGEQEPPSAPGIEGGAELGKGLEDTGVLG